MEARRMSEKGRSEKTLKEEEESLKIQERAEFIFKKERQLRKQRS